MCPPAAVALEAQTPTRPRYLSIDDVSSLTGLSRDALAQLRYRGKGPKFLNPEGTRVVLYREHDVYAWLEASERTITGDAA